MLPTAPYTSSARNIAPRAATKAHSWGAVTCRRSSSGSCLWRLASARSRNNLLMNTGHLPLLRQTDPATSRVPARAAGARGPIGVLGLRTPSDSIPHLPGRVRPSPQPRLLFVGRQLDAVRRADGSPCPNARPRRGRRSARRLGGGCGERPASRRAAGVRDGGPGRGTGACRRSGSRCSGDGQTHPLYWAESPRSLPPRHDIAVT